MAIKIFGDSFSVPFNFDINKDNRFCIDYLRDCLKNGNTPKDWITLLEDEGHGEIECFSLPGSDNLTIFESIIKQLPKIQEHDIIIIGWTSLDRIRCFERVNNFVTNDDVFLPLLYGFENDRYIYEKVKKNTNLFNEMMLYRVDHPNTQLELVLWMQMVDKLCEKLNINAVHWFWNPHSFGNNQNLKFEELPIYEELSKVFGLVNLHFGENGQWKNFEENGVIWKKTNNGIFCSYKKSIFNMTQGRIMDCHWGNEGHQIFFEIINKRIKSIYKN